MGLTVCVCVCVCVCVELHENTKLTHKVANERVALDEGLGALRRVEHKPVDCVDLLLVPANTSCQQEKEQKKERAKERRK